MRYLVVVILLLTVAIQAQTGAPSQYCKTNAEAESALSQIDAQDNPPFSRQRTALEELLAKYPDDLRVNTRYQEFLRNTSANADQRMLLEKYHGLAANHPDSFEYQYLYASALTGIDTPKAIAVLQGLVAKDASYPWSYLGLARIHDSLGGADLQIGGAFSDVALLRKELDSFLQICPDSLNEEVWHLIQRHVTPETAAQYGTHLRANLGDQIGDNYIQLWPITWDLEFRGAAGDQQEQVREQIRSDLQRLDKMRGEHNIPGLSTIRQGYELLGDLSSTIRVEQEMLARYPHNTTSNWVWRKRWAQEHPFPEDEEKLDAYYRLESRMFAEQLKILPDDAGLWFFQLRDLSALPETTPEVLESTADNLLRTMRADNAESSKYTMMAEFPIVQMYLQRKIRVDQVPALVEQAVQYYHEHNSISDLTVPDKQSTSEIWELGVKIESADYLAEAALELSKPEIARKAVTELQDATPNDPYSKCRLWTARAKFAESDGRQLDALVMYHLAIESRTPDSYVPKKDEVSASEQRLWKELGGTDASYTSWNKMPHNTEVAESKNWTKPAIELPPWKLRDLQGKIWKQSDFHGKTMLINVWASWCVPCRQELPNLQKLYEQVQGRSDIQIVTFNVDGELGKLLLFMKEKGYTFPVLLAQDYVGELKIESGIPRNWIIDARGKWLWDQTDFTPDPQWKEKMLAKIESAKTQ